MATQKTVDGKKYRLVGGKWKRDYSFGSNWKSDKPKKTEKKSSAYYKPDGSPRKKLNIKSKKTKSETAFEKSQKGRPWFLQGKLNPYRIVHDNIRNANYEKKRRKKLEDKNSSNKSRVTNEKDTGPTKLVKGEDGKVTRVRVSDNKNRKQLTFLQGAKAMESTKKGSTTKDDGGKAAWLKKTRNSPAAKSGAFTDDERWALQQKHRQWKADRKSGKIKKEKFDPRKGKGYRRKWVKTDQANTGSGRKGKPGTGTYGKSLPSNPQLKTQTTKDDRNPNRHAVKIAPKDLPKDKVKMKDGSIVDRSSLYNKKKKKKPVLFKGLSESFDN